LIIFTIVSASDSAGTFDINFAGGVDTAISDIATGGLWQQGSSYGNWRLIVRNLGWEHTRSFLYLQWLKIDEGKKEVRELLTIPIREFNTGDWRNIQKVEYQNNSFLIYYEIRGQEGANKATVEPALPGEYKINL